MRIDFDDAIGIVPPSPIDVDRLIARRRRRGMIRRLGAAGATGGVAAVALGVTVAFSAGGTPAGGAHGGPLGAAGPGRSPSASPTVAPSRTTAPTTSPTVMPSNEPPTPSAQAKLTETRLAQALKDAVHDHAPGYAMAASLDGAPFQFRYRYQAVTSTNTGSNWYYGSADLTGPAGKGNVSVTIGRLGSIWNPPTTCESDVADCSVTTGPDGETIMRRAISENGIRDNYVIVVRPDHTAILIVAANQRGQLDTGSPTQTDPVLTFEQLIAIGVDARVHA